MENGRRLSGAVLTWAAGFLLVIAAAPLPVGAEAASLEVVPRAKPLDVSLTRGEPATVMIDVRNSGEAQQAFGTLLFNFAKPGPGTDPKTPSPEIVYPKGIALQKGQATNVGIIFPAYEAVGDYHGELYFTGPQPGDQRALLIAFPVKVVEKKGPKVSNVVAGWVALALAALVLLLPLSFVGRKGGPGGQRGRSFFLTPADESSGEVPRYSVSRFQVWLWTAVILFSYTFLFLTQGGNVDIPSTVIGLMGISVGSIVTATTIAVKHDKNRDPGSAAPIASRKMEEKQNWLASMLSEHGSPSAMRLQMFAWTIAMTVFFVWRAVTTGTLWDIPPTLLALMGVSHGGYLIDKGVGDSGPASIGGKAA